MRQTYTREEPIDRPDDEPRGDVSAKPGSATRSAAWAAGDRRRSTTTTGHARCHTPARTPVPGSACFGPRLAVPLLPGAGAGRGAGQAAVWRGQCGPELVEALKARVPVKLTGDKKSPPYETPPDGGLDPLIGPPTRPASILSARGTRLGAFQVAIGLAGGIISPENPQRSPQEGPCPGLRRRSKRARQRSRRLG